MSQTIHQNQSLYKNIDLTLCIQRCFIGFALSATEHPPLERNIHGYTKYQRVIN